jgi:ribosomal protein L31E
MSISSDQQIVKASLDAMRELTLEQLREERENIARHLQDAITTAEMIIDCVIAEKIWQRAMN